MFSETGQVIQDQSYYPFGLSFGAELSYVNTLNSPKNKYLYNGKEIQMDFDLGWYDYGARFYNPELGRWSVIDPLLEKYSSNSPYNYVLNRPLIAFDPNGMESQNSHESDESGRGNYGVIPGSYLGDGSGMGNNGVNHKVYKHPDGHWISDQTMPYNSDFNKDVMLNMANAIGGGNPPERDWPPTAIKRSPTSFLDIEGYVWGQRATLEEELEIRNREALLARIDWEKAEIIITGSGYVCMLVPLPGARAVGSVLLITGEIIDGVSTLNTIVKDVQNRNYRAAGAEAINYTMNASFGKQIKVMKKLGKIDNLNGFTLEIVNHSGTKTIESAIDKNFRNE